MGSDFRSRDFRSTESTTPADGSPNARESEYRVSRYKDPDPDACQDYSYVKINVKTIVPRLRVCQDFEYVKTASMSRLRVCQDCECVKTASVSRLREYVKPRTAHR
jgi:hypothetical protein